MHFTPELLGEEAAKNKEEIDISKKMIEEINKVKHELILNGEKTSFFVRGENLFETYISKKSSKVDGILRRKIIAILEDRTFNSKDLLFTTTGIIVVGYYSLKAETNYRYISRLDTSGEALKIREKYKNINVDLEKMYALIQELAGAVESEEVGMK